MMQIRHITAAEVLHQQKKREREWTERVRVERVRMRVRVKNIKKIANALKNCL